uniref:glutathione transferase n=1 Tax=Callorhinchus milii TaxID=7868 RepID=K4GIM5_CALMI|nr:Glutathione S-transferase Mu 3 [Callorhinchus milii]
MVMKLGYWDIRGLAQPIRLLLEYTETPYEEKLYSVGEAPEYDRGSWLKEKFTLGLDFPNLPYLIDGDVKIVQSNAIMRYIARKHGLCGEVEDEKIRVDVIENQCMDFRMEFFRVCYSPDFVKLKPGYVEKLPDLLKQFSTFLSEKPWFAGEKITFVDFLLYEVLDEHLIFEAKSLDEFKNLQAFFKRFEALEKISAYMKSDRFMKGPINNKIAKWGNTK